MLLADSYVRDSYIRDLSSNYTILVLRVALFQPVQRRAQAELDVVIGRGRLTSFDDRLRLLYIEVMCKEMMRRQMVTLIGTIRDIFL